MRNIRKILYSSLLLLCTFQLNAAMKLVSATLRQGNGAPQMVAISAQLVWRVKNPDDKLATATLQLRPAIGNFDAIFSRDLTIPPKTELTDSTEVVLADTSEYLVELLQNGNRLQKETIPLRAIPVRHYLVAVMTDSFENLSMGQVQKNNNLSSHVSFVTHFQRNAPDHWGSLHGYSAVLLLSPALQTYSIRQQLAILDFVHQGGTLIIGGADAAFAMKGTLLEELLPFEPVGTYTADGLSAAAKAFRIKGFTEPPPFDANGLPTNRPNQRLLSAIPHDDATEILSQGGRTAVARKYVGRGTVIGLAFQPFELTRENTLFVLPIWEMLISNSRFHSLSKSAYEEGYANRALQQMQGYAIPPVSTIATILLAYILVGGCILAVMFTLRRHTQGWLLLCLFGLCITVYTMTRAHHITTSQSDLTLANLSLSNWDGKRGAAFNTTLFLSRSDMKPEVTYSLDELRTRPQPQNNNPLARGAAMPSTPVWFKDNGKEGHLETFTLQQMRPRTITWFSQGENHLHNRGLLPEVDYTETGLHLKEWKLPDDLKQTSRAVLLMPNGQRPLQVANGLLSDSGSSARIEADTLLTAVTQYLATMPVQTPTLALISQVPDSPPLKLAATNRKAPASVYDYDIVFVNARLPKDKKPDFIDRNMISYDLPGNSALRLALRGGEWHPIQYSIAGSKNNFISFHIPPEMATPSPEKIIFNFDILITISNMDIVPMLHACDGTPIAHLEKQGSSYVFYPAGKEVVSPLTSTILFSLVPTSSSPSAPQQNLMTRASFWQINSASLDVHLLR